MTGSDLLLAPDAKVGTDTSAGTTGLCAEMTIGGEEKSGKQP